MPVGANVIVFQSLKPPVPPSGGDPPPSGNPAPADFSGAGSQMLELDSAESLFSDLLRDVRGEDFLEAWQKRAHIPQDVVNGGMNLPDALTLQEVELEKMRRRRRSGTSFLLAALIFSIAMSGEQIPVRLSRHASLQGNIQAPAGVGAFKP